MTSKGEKKLTICEEALELLNNGYDGPDALEIYKIALEKAQKQEKLLELYKDLYSTQSFIENIKKRIKELEK